MLLIEAPRSTDPAFNLALEEHCLLNLPMDQEYLLLYVNGPSIVIGKHQNTVEEINTDFVEDHGIPVLRRQSGGGTVYHDPGNLNFSFIRRYAPRYFNNYDHFTGLVAEALRQMGVHAVLNARGDILVEGKKVSGNAQAVRRERMVSHGTLLFRSRLADVSEALRPKPGKIISKGRPSVRSQVANIGHHLPGMDMDAFREALSARLCGTATPARLHLGPEALEDVRHLAESKYRTWAWNYGQSPDFDLEREGPSGAVPVRVYLRVEKGMVRQVRLSADAADQGLLSAFAQALTGVRYHREDLRLAATGAKAGDILPGLGIAGWVRLLY